MELGGPAMEEEGPFCSPDMRLTRCQMGSFMILGGPAMGEEDPRKSCKMLDTKNAAFQILVHTNFREVCPGFI
jgi:hypothetical protein